MKVENKNEIEISNRDQEKLFEEISNIRKQLDESNDKIEDLKLILEKQENEIIKLNNRNDYLIQEKQEIISYNESIQNTNEKLMKNLVELSKKHKNLENNLNSNYDSTTYRDEKEENENLKKDLRLLLKNAENPSPKDSNNEDQNIRKIINLEKEIILLNEKYQNLYKNVRLSNFFKFNN